MSLMTSNSIMYILVNTVISIAIFITFAFATWSMYQGITQKDNSKIKRSVTLIIVIGALFLIRHLVAIYTLSVTMYQKEAVMYDITSHSALVVILGTLLTIVSHFGLAISLWFLYVGYRDKNKPKVNKSLLYLIFFITLYFIGKNMAWFQDLENSYSSLFNQ